MPPRPRRPPPPRRRADSRPWTATRTPPPHRSRPPRQAPRPRPRPAHLNLRARSCCDTIDRHHDVARNCVARAPRPRPRPRLRAVPRLHRRGMPSLCRTELVVQASTLGTNLALEPAASLSLPRSPRRAPVRVLADPTPEHDAATSHGLTTGNDHALSSQADALTSASAVAMTTADRADTTAPTPSPHHRRASSRSFAKPRPRPHRGRQRATRRRTSSSRLRRAPSSTTASTAPQSASSPGFCLNAVEALDAEPSAVTTSRPCHRVVPELRHRDQYLDAPSPSLPLLSVSHQKPPYLSFPVTSSPESGLHAEISTVTGKLEPCYAHDGALSHPSPIATWGHHRLGHHLCSSRPPPPSSRSSRSTFLHLVDALRNVDKTLVLFIIPLYVGDT